MEDLIQKFNLPKYIKGKSFADASKLIQSKFKDRDDAESLATKQDLLGRLRQAQDYVKKMNEAPEAADTPTPVEGDSAFQNQNFLGGILSGAGTGQAASAAGNMAGAEAMSGAGGGGMPSMGGSPLPAIIDMISATKKPDVDTSGATAMGYTSEAGSTAEGVMKGIEAGKDMGPWGMAGGALFGGITGAIKGKNANEAAEMANRNHTYANASAYDNQFGYGGKMKNEYATGGPVPGLSPELLGYLKQNSMFTAEPGDEVVSSVTPAGYQPQEITGELASPITSTSTPGINPDEQGSFLDKIFSGNGSGTTGAQALRYAAPAMNLAQLLSMKKPSHEGLDRINARYTPQLTDEQAIQNLVREQTADTNEAIVSSSGGSGSAARANLVGSSLQGTKALSDAYFNALQANQQENRVGQEFNLGVDQINLRQSNIENDINARNKGNFDTQKSKLLAALGDDIGNIGKEELFKKYPELMGADYNWLGKFIKSKEQVG